MCPAKTQISLGIRPVKSESSPSTWRFAGCTVILLVLSCCDSNGNKILKESFACQIVFVRSHFDCFYLSWSMTKPTKWCVPSKDSGQRAHICSLISLQDQDQDSLLVKCRNDNHSPRPVIRELVPSSHQRSELSNTILCIFSGWDQRIGEGIPIPDSLHWALSG